MWTCCRHCVRAAKWIPVLFIMSIVTWSYYAYVVHICLYSVQKAWQQILLLVLYHFFLTMFVWSYWRTVFTPPGNVPSRFFLTLNEVDSIETANDTKAVLDQVVISKDLPCTMRTYQQEVRFCSECSLIKPDRAHHCGVCGQCVLKMDHHCPWVNNCVAFMNYKFFILFLGYALLYCIYVALSSLQYFLEFWSKPTSDPSTSKFQILFLFFVSVMFSISLASLFFYHLYLVSRNMSTLEAFRTPIFRHGSDKQAFNLGSFNNFQEVFGDNKMSWLFPIFTSFGDGITYPQRGPPSDEETGLLGSTNAGISPGSEERMPMIMSAQIEEQNEKMGNSRHVSSSSGSEVDFRNNSTVRSNANGHAKFNNSSSSNHDNEMRSDMALVNM